MIPGEYELRRQRLNKEFEKFKKTIPHHKLSGLYDYIDFHIKYFKENYREQILNFCLMCEKLGIYYQNTCYVEETMFRKLIDFKLLEDVIKC